MGKGSKKDTSQHLRAITSAQDDLGDVDKALGELQTLVLVSCHRMVANYVQQTPRRV